MQKQVGGIKLRNKIDGDKWICFDEIYDIKNGSCITLSFGINNEWSYDDSMDKIYGCKVYIKVFLEEIKKSIQGKFTEQQLLSDIDV